ncbi:MAG TPA: TonB-dependent receptor [Steroidobacteraceae bacterium]|nr:TonB-dependent receptor [Steroidobacteraceae bacterium]
MSHRSLMLRRAVATTLAISCVIGAPITWAQTESGDTLGAVIVTAQKREQNLQDVPIVVTAVSEQLLHDTGVKDIKDLTVLTPGLLVTSSSSEASTTARLRGIGTVGDNPGLESSVGIVIDGVYRPRNGVGFGDLGEMERIEVLKGPQGTLFGKNITAGVINVVSKKPTFDPSSVLEVTGGNLGTFDIASSINGPLAGDAVAGRLFVALRKRDGLVDVLSEGGSRVENDDNNRDFYTVRGQLLFNLSDAVNLRVIGDVTDRDEYCCAAVQVNYGSTGVRNLINAVSPGIGGAAVPDPYARIAYSNRSTTNLTRDRGVSAELNWDVSDMELVSVTAWRDWRSTRAQDADFTTADLVYRVADGSVFSRFQQFSQEVRLAGQTGPVNWLGGLFFAKEKLNAGDQLRPGTNLEFYTSLTASAGATATGLAAALGRTPGTLFGGANIDTYEQQSESFAVFTNNSIEITDGLELTIGARYTAETKDLDSSYWNADSTSAATCAQIRTNYNTTLVGFGAGRAAIIGYGCAAAFDPNFANLNTSESLDESKLTGTAKIAYRFTDAIMTYASYARGYKASGYNLDRERDPSANPLVPTPSTDKSFVPETVDSYEVGVKTTLADGALLLNFAGYRQTYDNFQFNTFTGIQFEVRTLTEVQSRGIDADVLYRTPFGLGIQGGVTYSKTDIIDAGANADLFNNLRESNRMPFAPVWTGSMSLTYRQTVGDFAFGSNIGAKYNSDFNTGSNLDPRKIQDSYTLVNARLSFGADDEKWNVELWGQNLTNEEYAQVMFDATFQGSSATGTPTAPALPTSTIDAFLGAQRLYGATLLFKF